MTYVMYVMGARRINARIDDDLAEKLDVLRAKAGLSTTDVLREAIERYHETLEAETGQHAREAFGAAGFVACAEGPRDLASRTKAYLLEAYETKHPRLASAELVRDGASLVYGSPKLAKRSRKKK